jgi:allantoin racemase
VVGMSEAAMLTACMLGKRFGIVTFATSMEPWYQECVESHGLINRLAGIRCAKGGFTSVNDVAEEKAAALIELARQSIEEDGADVIILAGAPLAGLANKVKDRVAVPLVDQICAAVRQAETLAALAVSPARAGTFRRPGPKDSQGLPTALAARINHRD